MVESRDCIRNAHECMARARRASSEEAKVELLQLATAWMELEDELGRKQDSPASGASQDADKRVKDCVAHAEMCRALAARSAHPRRKAKLLELAAKWIAMAENG
jgi:hypothetical protein